MAAAEMLWRLKQATGNADAYIPPLGITYQEYLHTDVHSVERNYLVDQDCEKVPHAGLTGEDFGGGRTLLLDFKGLGTSAAADHPARCHVPLIHETAMSIT